MEESEEGTSVSLACDDDEPDGERGMPVFKMAFALAGALAVARLLRIRR